MSSIFGSTSGPTTTATGGGPSANPQSATNTSTGGLFGNTSMNTQSAANTSTGGLFGNTSMNTQSSTGTGGSFGSTTGLTTNNLAPRPPGTQPQSGDAQIQFAKLVQNIESIYNSWNPQSKDCRFQYPFYNLVDPKQVSLYGRPPNATNDLLWTKAVKENPDPSCLVPVIAVGFDDLRARVDAQSAQSTSHLQKVKDIQSRLEALRTQHAVSNTSRTLRASSRQTELTQRAMHLIQRLHLLIPSIRSSALRSEEEGLRGKLEEIEEELRRGRIKGRLNELWALIGAIGAGANGSSGGANSEGGWAVVDEDGLVQIAQILAEQQAGLQHLTRILQKDLKDLNVVMGVGSTEEVHEAGSDNLWSSTSTLRASALR